MKVLLVTEQLIETKGNECWCNYALRGTLENFSVLGELYVIAGKIPNDRKPAQPLTERISFLQGTQVAHLLPTRRNIRQHFENTKINHRTIERFISGMDLVVGYAPSESVNYAQKVAHQMHIPFMSFLVACPWDAQFNHRRLLARIMAPISYISTRRLIRKSDYVHYVTKRFLQRRYPTDAFQLGCSDINLGMMDAHAVQKRLMQRENRQKNIVKMVTTGNLDIGYKGQEYVIRAMNTLNEMGGVKFHYYLIGGRKGIALRQLAESLGLSEYVHFLGILPIEGVFQTLSDCDIYLQPSLQEGLPRSVVEAMSCAMPCIGFRTGGIPELLEDKYVVKRKDVAGLIQAILRLCDEQEYLRVAKRNYEEALCYEHTLVTKQIRGFYIDIKEQIERARK